MIKRLLAFTLVLALTPACPREDEPTIAKDIFAPLGEPMPWASDTQIETFERGREVATRDFTAATGLGPTFNVGSCTACHERPVTGGASPRYRNFLLVCAALDPETCIPTGFAQSPIQQQYDLAQPARVPTSTQTDTLATRNAIPFFGVGLLAQIPAEEILRREDPNDVNGDGISGRANFENTFVGRFGRKAQVASLEAFVRGPLFNHVGITTNPLTTDQRALLPFPPPPPPPEENLPGIHGTTGDLEWIALMQGGAPDEPTVDEDPAPDPELAPTDLFDLVSFTMLLAAPQPDELSDTSRRGKQLFKQIGCDACHVPALGSPRGLIPLYSDLLIHDMGPDLDDGITQGLAVGSEFRTQPLWGVAAAGPWLHDGRADTLAEAITLHGGEGEAASTSFSALGQADQDALIAFLESLGGKDDATPGLLPPDAVTPDVGEYGGPGRNLSATELERFERGRRIFDGDFTLTAGLGPRFNGDSCRACHFQGEVGGSGSADVDVMRHGIESGGIFTEPSIGGTIAHKLSATPGDRPPIDENANVFETRQTPQIFGLGPIDTITEADIIANEDPADGDGDGISGRAHILGDGRVGRLGWKADVPSVAEFARDAMTNEMGATLPPQAGLTFGSEIDNDTAADPEIPVEDLEDLVFFMVELAPPPRTHVSLDAELLGEQLFDVVGCTGCHFPSLGGVDGLYSDLLLHDVAPPNAVGIESGDATMREFRTPPLWGLNRSAPYMHDGRSFTVEDAVLRHSGEATTSREEFLNLSTDERAAVIAFLRSL